MVVDKTHISRGTHNLLFGAWKWRKGKKRRRFWMGAWDK